MKRTILVLGLASLFAAACSRSAPEAAHEHEGSSVTQWNGTTELFLEYPPLITGQQSGNWAIHLSDMDDFKPITSGTLDVRFLDAYGRQAATFHVDKPARNGIFLLDPRTPAAGTYRVELSLRSPQAVSTHVLPEVRVFANEAQIPHAEGEEASGGISFLKEQQWVIDFRVEPAQEREVAQTVSVPGEVVPMDGAQAVVSAPASGIATADANRNAPSIGAAVRRGQVLAVLSPTAEEGGYARIRESTERLEREAARAQRLFEAGAIPRRRLEEARHELSVARAEARAMGGGPDADYRFRVRAPISGVVTARSFVPGGRVAAGEPLFTVIDPSTIWIRMQLSAGDAGRLSRSGGATFTVEGDRRVYEAPRLVSVGSAVDPQNRTVPVVFAAPNPGGVLRIGEYVRAAVRTGGVSRGVAIPSSAILDDGGIPVAYIQAEGETFERRRLTIGQSDGRVTEVLEGIRPGEMVVTVGAYQVRLASMSNTPMSGGHAH
jgi:membrane fusion protein, heavy metal efflux system